MLTIPSPEFAAPFVLYSNPLEDLEEKTVLSALGFGVSREFKQSKIIVVHFESTILLGKVPYQKLDSKEGENGTKEKRRGLLGR